MLCKAGASPSNASSAIKQGPDAGVRMAQIAADSEGQTATAAERRMQKLKEVLGMREHCIAHLQDKLRREQANHAQVFFPLPISTGHCLSDSIG